MMLGFKKLMVALAVVFALASTVQAKEITLQVSGMVCAFCAAGIEKKFKGKEGVESVHVDLEKKVVHLGLKNEADISDDNLKSLINEAGYDLVKIERK